MRRGVVNDVTGVRKSGGDGGGCMVNTARWERTRWLRDNHDEPFPGAQDRVRPLPAGKLSQTWTKVLDVAVIKVRVPNRREQRLGNERKQTSMDKCHVPGLGGLNAEDHARRWRADLGGDMSKCTQ